MVTYISSNRLKLLFSRLPTGCIAFLLLIGGCQKAETSPPKIQDLAPRRAACENLHRITDINDLLQQLHENLDSTCVFEVPLPKLEKIWGVKIFGEGRHMEEVDGKSPIVSEDFAGKPYHSPADTFYISALRSGRTQKLYLVIRRP